MSEPIWDTSALSDADRFSYALQYTGATPAATRCIIGSSPSASFLVRALISRLSAPRVGAFEIEVSTITNPGDYANGAAKIARPSHTSIIPVHAAGPVLLIATDGAPKCPHLLAPAVYDTFRAAVTVLDSIHESLFIGDVAVPSLIVLAAAASDPRFGAANSVTGLAAALATYGRFHGVDWRVLEIVEDDFGASREAFELWVKGLAEELPIADAEAVIAEACVIAGIRTGPFCGIYS